MAITDRDRQEWAHHPVTEEFLRLLRESRQETLESWAAEVYVGETAERTAQCNAKALGGVNMLEQVVGLVEGWRVVVQDEVKE